MKHKTSLYEAFITAKNKANRKLSLFDFMEVKFLCNFFMFVMYEILFTKSFKASPFTNVRYKPMTTFS
jgi:hypothetical protein